MRILLVGAGAVGQVFGHHLQRGGAEVAFLVKPKHAEATGGGFTLYPLNRRNPRRAPVRFEGFEVLTTTEEVAARSWDAVLLCTASNALRAGDWVREVAEATGDATIVGLQPGLEDPPLVREAAGIGRVVWGLIEFIAYAGPLQGEELPEPGTVYWLAPVFPFPFSGPAQRIAPIVAALRAGGLRARTVPDVARDIALSSPLLLLHMAALECAGWRFDAIRRDTALLELTAAAVREAISIAAHEYGTGPHGWLRWLRPWQVRLVSRLAPVLLPLPIETYLQFHFTKVRPQTLEQLGRWMALAEGSGQSGEAMAALAARLRDEDAGNILLPDPTQDAHVAPRSA